MAHICLLPKGSCKSCKYYRLDEEENRMACFTDHNVKTLEPSDRAAELLKSVREALRAAFGSWGVDWCDYGNTCSVRYWGRWILPEDCDPEEEDYDWKVLDPEDYNMANSLVKDIADHYNVKIRMSVGEKCYLDFYITEL